MSQPLAPTKREGTPYQGRSRIIVLSSLNHGRKLLCPHKNIRGALDVTPASLFSVPLSLSGSCPLALCPSLLPCLFTFWHLLFPYENFLTAYIFFMFIYLPAFLPLLPSSFFLFSLSSFSFTTYRSRRFSCRCCFLRLLAAASEGRLHCQKR